MLDPAHVPPVASNEELARFILASSHIRSSNNTIKPDAFMPHPLVALSLTRHRDATEQELWREGDRVAGVRGKSLYGRADVSAAAFVVEGLSVEEKPLPENPNHADALNWPAEKPAQKMKALQIASQSQYIPKPS